VRTEHTVVFVFFVTSRIQAENMYFIYKMVVQEMESQAMLAHGASSFLKERLFDSSDKFVFYVCKDCGMIAIANPVKNIFKCSYCNNTTKFSKVFVPYASKLMWQELMSMGIAPRMLTGLE
jgi:DNA-directed RNA polymerase II subunit RPB2